MIPSEYQKAVYNWIENGTGNAVINAVAGSGKTTTLIEASKLIPSTNLLFIAFNKHIVNTLSSRFSNGKLCRTIHSIGGECVRKHLRKYTFDDLKYKKLCLHASGNLSRQLENDFESQQQAWTQSNGEGDEPRKPPKTLEIQAQIEKLVNLSRFTLTPLSDIQAVEKMVDHFGIERYIDIAEAAKIAEGIVDYGDEMAFEGKVIDYSDMIWLPYKWNLKPDKHDWILIDEAQDLNALQLNLIMKMVGSQSRMIFVGDPQQAIYGFTGADADSFIKIKNITNANALPLSICYRCPAKVVEFAKELVPQIEVKPNAPTGEIIRLKEDAILQYIQEGDLVVCRTTEPLVRLCIKLISNHVSATVKGKDIGLSLISIVEEVGKVKNFSFFDFQLYLNYYKQERIERLSSRVDATEQIENFTDQIKCIEVIYQNFMGLESITDLCNEIGKLFSDYRSSVTLSTIHRAKGLEENRVFILYFEKLPFIWPNQRDWQFQQEKNLKYVAITRTKEKLFLVAEIPQPVNLNVKL